jgi:uncharacterized protein (TIGR03435 family)
MRKLAAILTLSAVATDSAAYGQAAGSPHIRVTDVFEVASVRPAGPQPGAGRWSGGPGSADPSRVTFTNTSLLQLCRIALNAPNDFQLAAPPWAESQRFDIVATMQPDTKSEQYRKMLQNLLVERFGLVFHTEERTIPGYDLVVGKKGIKLKDVVLEPSAAPNDPAGRSGATVNQNRRFRFYPDGQVKILARDHNMEGIVQICQNRTHKPVTDKTGLQGRYDFDLSYSDTPASMPASEPSGTAAGPAGPALSLDVPAFGFLGAIEAQLGLRLEAKKQLVDIVIIDRLERAPTEN